MKRNLRAAACAAAILLASASCVSSGAKPEQTAATPAAAPCDRTLAERNKAVVQRYFDEMWNRGETAIIDEIVAPDYLHHPSAGADGHGPDYVRNVVATLRAAFPDAQFTVERMVAEGDLVATQVTMTGTHRGPFAGIDATGRAVRRKEMLMHRVVGGKLVEGWSLPDRKGLLDQLQAP